MELPQSLSKNERWLLFSYLLFVLASPIFSTFTNTFLWRHSHDPVQLAVYNIGMYAGVPLGFLLAETMLRRWRYKRLFFLGSVLQGVIPLVITIVRPSSFGLVALLGALFGIPMGLYWANRNLITLRATEGRHRLSFLSVESAQNIAAGIVAPFLIGLFLASHAANIGLAYVVLMTAGLLMLLVAGAAVATTDVDPMFQRIGTLLVPDPSARWKRQRWFEFVGGIQTVYESVLSLLVILTLLGQEASVGSVKSGVAILAAAAMFLVGKKIPERLYGRVFLIAFALIGGTSALFALGYDAPTALVFFAAFGVVASFRQVVAMSVMFRTIDAEVARTDGNRFLYLFDRETFLNFGRIFALIVFIACVTVAPTATLRYGLLATSLLHVPMLYLVKKLS
ncbi:MAG: MFS transporter [Candidatus Uhrbacteria bacterium]